MKKLIEKPGFHLFFLVGIAIALPINKSLLNGFIISYFLLSLFLFLSEAKFRKLIFNPILIFPFLFYLYSLINGLFGYNIDQLLRHLDKNLLSIILPFSILISFRKIFLDKILRFFNLSLLVVTLVLLINNILKFINGSGMSSLHFHQFTSLIDEHAVYFSLYLSLGIFISLDQIQKSKKKNLNKWMILIFSIGLWFCSSKAIFLSSIFLSIFYLILKRGITKKKIIVSLLIFILISISVNFNPYLKKRFVEGFSYDVVFNPTDKIDDAKVFSKQELYDISGFELRIIFIKISIFHLINDGKLMFGYGVSDYQDHLDYYYMRYGLAPFYFEGYSPHNQYVQTLVKSGIIGLLFLLLYLIYSFYYALNNKHHLYLVFLILFSFAMLFEAYLLRNKGIVFFFYFNSIFLYFNQIKLSRVIEVK